MIEIELCYRLRGSTEIIKKELSHEEYFDPETLRDEAPEERTWDSVPRGLFLHQTAGHPCSELDFVRLRLRDPAKGMESVRAIRYFLDGKGWLTRVTREGTGHDGEEWLITTSRRLEGSVIDRNESFHFGEQAGVPMLWSHHLEHLDHRGGHEILESSQGSVRYAGFDIPEDL